MFRNIICTLAAIILIATTSAFAEESNFTKAENFMKIGRYYDVISVLEAQIQLKSDDAKAYFMLGNIHLRLNNFAGADKEFLAAVTFRPAYRNEVAKKYFDLGLASLKMYRPISGLIRPKNSKEVDKAISFFTQAVKYQTSMVKSVADSCFRAGKDCLTLSQLDTAKKLFAFAKRDTSLVKQIQVEETKYGERILAEAKEELSEDKRQVAIRYLGQEKVNAEFPPKDWVVVFTAEYIGKGYDSNDSKQYHIPTVKFGEVIRYGDKIILKTSGEFKVWDGVWEKHLDSAEIKSRNKTGGIFFIEAQDGEAVILEIQRFMYPSEKEKLANFSLNQ